MCINCDNYGDYMPPLRLDLVPATITEPTLGAQPLPQTLGLFLFVDLEHFRSLKPTFLTLCLSLVPGFVLLPYFVP